MRPVYCGLIESNMQARGLVSVDYCQSARADASLFEDYLTENVRCKTQHLVVALVSCIVDALATLCIEQRSMQVRLSVDDVKSFADSPLSIPRRRTTRSLMICWSAGYNARRRSARREQHGRKDVAVCGQVPKYDLEDQPAIDHDGLSDDVGRKR